MPAAPPTVAHHAPLAEVTRGEIVESLHAGSVAVVDMHGRVLRWAGNPQHLTFTRSALKPLQALPFVAAGGVEHFGLSSSKVALLCASHSGEPRHAEAAADILARAGCTPADLQCGTHAPRFYDTRGEVPPPPPYSPLQHNCSGKHSGMLAFCALCQWPKASYLEFDHPLQQAIRQSVSTFTGVTVAALVPGVDGCSAPNYAVPLSALARAFARLASATDDPDYGTAPRTLADAMLAHPEMVSGEGRSDLALMQAGRGDWVAKIGAEGVQAIGVRSRGIGIAVKVADGQARGLLPSVVAVLDQLGLLDEAARAALAPWGRRPIRNYRGTQVGAIRPAVLLEGPASGPGRDSAPETAGHPVNRATAEL
ncbi:MAG: asparaginase [Betaproteobacteria bacterium]|nr:asparaginase [Betaproteobacteria bacterium]MDE2004015.1 asparaginase [Betaproteobacteria bacterium]MDE2209087.1 asparaginase [Betaproteobacteria bacterium]MDE2360756.1 asparaginase [Betaproteobacteria bacterium]